MKTNRIAVLTLLSLAGIPLTAGFVGKFYVLAAGVGSSLWLLVLILVANSAIGLYTHAHWAFLVRAFEELVLTKREQMPLERTLLTNGILLAGLTSRRKGGAWIETPELAFSYSWPR